MDSQVTIINLKVTKMVASIFICEQTRNERSRQAELKYPVMQKIPK